MSPPTSGWARPAPRGSATTRGGATRAGRGVGPQPDARRRRRRSTSRSSTTALTPGNRATAEDRGIDVIEGARARRCRVAVDGATFAAAFPQVRWLVGDADLHRWRGQLDYWVFVDGQLGQVAGDASGEATGIDPEHLLGDVASS